MRQAFDVMAAPFHVDAPGLRRQGRARPRGCARLPTSRARPSTSMRQSIQHRGRPYARDGHAIQRHTDPHSRRARPHRP
jgi:hypothetical protein